MIDRLADQFLLDGQMDKNGYSLETKLFLGEVSCTLTRVLAVIGGPLFVEQVAAGGIGTNFDLKTDQVNVGWTKIGPKWIKKFVPDQDEKLSDKFTTTILLQDDMSDDETSRFEAIKNQKQLEIAGKVITSEFLLPIDDSVVIFGDQAQADRIARDLKFVQGKALPLSYNTDFNMNTDESFSRIFFHGIAAPLIATSEAVTNPDDLKYGPFVVDMDFMKGLKIRSDLYKHYGARVHFDANQKVSAIYCSDADKLFLPGEPGWEEAKLQAKVSALLLTTVREHLSQTHLIVSNDASREIVKTMHPEHPIRRLLAIFTYNAVSVNLSAFQVLVPENSVIQRGTALAYEGGVTAVFDNAYETSIAYEPFAKRTIKNPSVEQLAKDGKFPYLSEGRESYTMIEKMVIEWLSMAGEEAKDEYARNFYEAMRKSSEGQAYVLPKYSHENMIDLVTTIAFTVTAFHEIIGHVPDYADSPFKNGLRVPRESPTVVDFQGFIISAVVASATSPPAPQLLAKFPNYIGAGGAPTWERDVWTKFVSEMGLQSKKVQEADRKRDFEFKYFDPSLYECSVSV